MFKNINGAGLYVGEENVYSPTFYVAFIFFRAYENPVEFRTSLFFVRYVEEKKWLIAVPLSER